MFEDTIADWQSLTKLYGEMSDGELLELDAQLGDLTEMAQQVLRDEMKKRGLNRPRPADNAPKPIESFAALQGEYGTLSPMDEGEAGQSDQPHEYTWKTLLCACDEWEEAWQISEALRRAGIESWMQGPGSGVRTDLSTTGVLVAADQLDEAREIAARPISQEIIDESKTDSSEF